MFPFSASTFMKVLFCGKKKNDYNKTHKKTMKTHIDYWDNVLDVLVILDFNGPWYLEKNISQVRPYGCENKSEFSYNKDNMVNLLGKFTKHNVYSWLYI